MDTINISYKAWLSFASSWLIDGVNNALSLTAAILAKKDSLTDKMAVVNATIKTKANQLEQWVLCERSSPDLVYHKEDTR